ncbi:hypothetical protein ACFPPE_06945, partial [Agromyces tardus]
PPAPPVPPAPSAAYGAPAAAPTPYGAPAAPYGAPAQPAYGAPAYGAPAAKPSPVLSIISLIAGIIGLIGAGVVAIPFVGSILQIFIPGAAVVLGFLGRKKEPAAKAMWLTGIILGFVGIGIALIGLVFWAIVFASSGVDYSY